MWRDVIARHPTYPLPHRWLAAAYGQLGRRAEATQALQQAQSQWREAFEFFVGNHAPWVRAETHAHMLEGLRKAGWRG